MLKQVKIVDKRRSFTCTHLTVGIHSCNRSNYDIALLNTVTFINEVKQ